MKTQLLGAVTALTLLAGFGCGANDLDLDPELDQSDLDVAAAQKKGMKMVATFNASKETTKKTGVVKWQLSKLQYPVSKGNKARTPGVGLAQGYDKNGKVIVADRTQLELDRAEISKNPYGIGKLTVKGRPTITYRYTVSHGRRLFMSKFGLNNYKNYFQTPLAALKNDFQANRSKVKFGTAEDCFWCAVYGVGCVGGGAACVAGTFATMGAAIACVAPAAASCAGAGFECMQCAMDDSKPDVSVEIGDITICFRSDPCWCDNHPDECFTPIGTGT